MQHVYTPTRLEDPSSMMFDRSLRIVQNRGSWNSSSIEKRAIHLLGPVLFCWSSAVGSDPAAFSAGPVSTHPPSVPVIFSLCLLAAKMCLCVLSQRGCRRTHTLALVARSPTGEPFLSLQENYPFLGEQPALILRSEA